MTAWCSPRAPQTLAEVRAECLAAGAAAVETVPTDVTDPDAVDALARTTLAHLGRIGRPPPPVTTPERVALGDRGERGPAAPGDR